MSCYTRREAEAFTLPNRALALEHANALLPSLPEGSTVSIGWFAFRGFCVEIWFEGEYGVARRWSNGRYS